MGCHALLVGIFRSQGLKLCLLHLPALAGRFFTTSATSEAPELHEVKVKVSLAQSCPTLCDSMDCSLPRFSVPGILQARILEWVAIPFSRGILPTQGSNLGLLHCRQILYCLSHREVRVIWVNINLMGEVIPELDLEEIVISPRDQIGIKYNQFP